MSVEKFNTKLNIKPDYGITKIKKTHASSLSPNKLQSFFVKNDEKIIEESDEESLTENKNNKNEETCIPIKLRLNTIINSYKFLLNNFEIDKIKNTNRKSYNPFNCFHKTAEIKNKSFDVLKSNLSKELFKLIQIRENLINLNSNMKTVNCNLEKKIEKFELTKKQLKFCLNCHNNFRLGEIEVIFYLDRLLFSHWNIKIFFL